MEDKKFDLSEGSISDPEKNISLSYTNDCTDTDTGIVTSDGIFGTIQRFANKFNMETKGVERVLPEEQTETSLINIGTMWFAANMVVATFSLGTLGIAIFGMGFWDSVLTIIFFNFLGMLPVAFFSLFGPRFGLRQMILSRYWFGYHGIKIFAFLNCIACIGWAALNCVVASGLLHSVNNGSLPPWGASIVITFATLMVTMFGYKVVHVYEKYSWIPTFVILLIVIARLKMSGNFTFGHMNSGRIEAGSVLSFGASVFGYSTGWSTFAADYVVYQRRDTPKIKIFSAIVLGLGFPLIFCMILGAACMSTTLIQPSYADQYNEDGVGGLLYSILVQDSLHGFGQFCLVILALSTVANNCPNFYSVALSVQSIDDRLAKIPRILWTIVGAGVSLAIAIPAYYKFETFMDNFMNIIGYWLAIYEGIAFCEHFIFIGGFSNYDLNAYTSASALPVGLAAFAGFGCGVAGAVLGMYQTWYTGPIAATFSGDLGFELAFGFAFVGYFVSRSAEKKIFGR
ncbi:permease for cytosine/purines, uracil, thiamine, allantoin-domain-containing protein [Dipodascopsis uninucleata]